MHGARNAPPIPEPGPPVTGNTLKPQRFRLEDAESGLSPLESGQGAISFPLEGTEE